MRRRSCWAYLPLASIQLCCSSYLFSVPLSSPFSGPSFSCFLPAPFVPTPAAPSVPAAAPSPPSALWPKIRGDPWGSWPYACVQLLLLRLASRSAAQNRSPTSGSRGAPRKGSSLCSDAEPSRAPRRRCGELLETQFCLELGVRTPGARVGVPALPLHALRWVVSEVSEDLRSSWRASFSAAARKT
jgi:hypothetical protein